jgi:tetratricopeptide (TPR) repeat protein
MAEALGLELVQAHALINVGTVQAMLGDAEGVRNLELSIELADRLNSPQLARAYHNLATAYAAIGDLPACFETWHRGVAAAERFGESEMVNWLRHQVDFPVAYVEGRWDDVVEAAEANLEQRGRYLHRNTYEHRGRIRLARGDVAGALEDAEAALAIGRGIVDPQALVPALSFAAFARLASGRPAAAGALVDELLGLDALRRPVPHHSPWLDVAWVLIDLDRVQDLTAVLREADPRTRWVEAAEALARGDYLAAARLYEDARSLPAAAYIRLRAAQAGLPDAGLDVAIAFFRKAGATAYLNDAEALLAATA